MNQKRDIKLRKKRFWALFLVMLMLLNMFPASVFAENVDWGIIKDTTKVEDLIGKTVINGQSISWETKSNPGESNSISAYMCYNFDDDNFAYNYAEATPSATTTGNYIYNYTIDPSKIDYTYCTSLDSSKKNAAAWYIENVGIDFTGSAGIAISTVSLSPRYSIDFVDDNDEKLCDTQYLGYGVKKENINVPSVSDKTIGNTKYVFSKWNKEIDDVKGNAVYKAEYTSTTYYTIQFVDYDGTSISSDSYPAGTSAASITPASNPTRAASTTNKYTFNGWTPAITDVTDDAVYTATYKELATIKFVDDDDSEISTADYDYGTPAGNIAKPSDPTKADGADCSYVFTGWTPAIEDVTVHKTYKATYKQTAKIKFVDDDDSVILDEATYDCGTPASAINKPADPTKQKDKKYTYEFEGWDPAITDVTKNQVYKAKYKKTLNKYIVTFTNDDNSLIDEKDYDYGTLAKDIDQPTATKPETAQYKYEFSNWTPALADVTDDATYKANYRNVLREYDITFINEGQTYAVGKYSYGTKAATITPTTVPSKNPSKEYVYTFDKWTPDIEDVSKNQTYTASYKKEKRKYNVKFVDFDDTEISSSLYEYGTLDTSIVKPADPSYSVDSVHYHFTGWTPEITNVYGDAVYKATYAPNNYHITFVGKDGVLSETDYPYNTKAGDIKVPDTTVANTAEYTYTFTGWDKQITDVVGDETYIARYDAKKQKYFISFVDEDGTTELKAVTEYEYGTAAADIEKPDDPTKNETPEYIYTFDKWTPEIVEVTGNATYKATYSKTLKKYKVTFVDDDGTVLKEATEYDFGTKAADIVRPAEPSKAETDECTYSFGGWTPEVTDVGTKDVTYTATYTKKIKEYKVTWKDGDGKVLKTDSVKYNEMPSYSGDTPTKKATADTRFKFNNKWTPEIVKVTGDATYTAEFDASKIVMHTLSFDLNGGTLNGKNGTVTIEAEEGTEITIPDAPTREGYKFTYWKGSEYHPGDKYKVEGDHTFTAQWEEIKKETTEQPTTEAPKPAQQPTTEAPKPAEQPTTEAPKPAAPTAVQTGDNVNILLFIVLMAISLLGIISILVLKKKQRYN